MACGINDTVTMTKSHQLQYDTEANYTQGPIIRIAPNHLHISEPEFCDEHAYLWRRSQKYRLTSGFRVFNVRTRYIKEYHFYGSLGPEKSLPAIRNPENHRIHHGILNSTFSKQAVSKKHFLVEKVNRAVDLIRRRAETKSPVEIELRFRRVTVRSIRCAVSLLSSKPSQMDVVSRTLFGHFFNLIDSDDEFPPELRMLANFVGDSGIIKHFPILKSNLARIAYVYGQLSAERVCLLQKGKY